MRCSLLPILLVLGILPIRSFSQTPQLFINEFLASNASTYIDPEYSSFTDWVEIYNGEDGPIDLGYYYLSDNPDRPEKWRFPANTWLEPDSVLLVWTDGNDSLGHANFKLSRDGEEIGLYDLSGNEIDRVIFLAQEPDISFGRQPDGGEEWVYFSEPTPGRLNTNRGSMSNHRAPSPVFSLRGGHYDGPVSIELSTNPDDTEIFYTLDGSKPTSGSTPYSNPIVLTTTTVIRAVSVSAEYANSPVATSTYILDDAFSLPVVSLSTDPEYLWDREVGIFENGSNCQSLEDAHCCQSWERPAHFEYFDSDGDLGLSLTTGMKVRGTTSCLFPRKQLGIYARDKYGWDEYSYQFFPDKHINTFKRLIFRPGAADGLGNLYHGTMLRDEMIATLVQDRMDIDYSASQPAVLLLNGEYMGVHNIRERVKQHYFSTNYGYDPDDVEIIENSYNGGVYQGDDQHYMNMLNFLATNSIEDSLNYQILKTMMDLDEFINYQIVQLYIANIEWGHLNVQCWRPRTIDGKWRWVLWDVEGSFDIYPDGRTSHLVNSFEYSEDDYLRHRWLFEQLLTNDKFRNEFIQRFSAHLNTTFYPDRVSNIIDSLKSLIEPEMERDILRWRGECQYECGVSSPLCTIESYAAWEANIERMHDFADDRPGRMRRHIRDKFGLTASASLTLEVAGSGKGSLHVNGVEITESNSRGSYFVGVPLNISAVPEPGYRFDGWSIVAGPDPALLTVTLTGDSTVTARFVPTGQAQIPQSISQDTHLDVYDSPYLVAQDVVVEAGVSLSIDPGVEIHMADGANLYVYGDLQSLGTVENPVSITKLSQNHTSTWGGIYFENATASLQSTEINNASHGPDPFSQKAAISGLNSTVELLNVSLDNVMLPVFMESCEVTIDHISINTGIELGDYIHILRGNAQVKNSVFQGRSFARDVDAIDCDEVESAIIRGNKFYNISGDAIDIGDGSNAVLIEHNQIYDSLDKGISIGEHSLARANRNLILNCVEGIAVKDSSYAILNQNTLVGNITGVASYEKFLNQGGGTAYLVNSIFTGSLENDYGVDHKSTLSVTNSLSDTQLLPGPNNLFQTPIFQDHAAFPYYLAAASPCVDAGVTRVTDGADIIIEMARVEYSGLAPDLGAFEYGFSYDSNGQLLDVLINDHHLGQNFPNPFNPTTRIYYTIKEAGYVRLSVYDLRGREVLRLKDGHQEKGEYEFTWDGRSSTGETVSTGLYFCRLNVGNYSKAIKMVYMK